MAEEGERDNVSLLRAPTDSISDEAPETVSEAVGETPTEAPVEAPETREETRDGVIEHSLDGETHHGDWRSSPGKKCGKEDRLRQAACTEEQVGRQINQSDSGWTDRTYR